MVESTGADRQEMGRVPLDDIAAVIANAHGLSYTNNILVACAERGIPFVLCAANHNAIGLLLTIEGNSLQAGRMQAQLSSSKPLQKQLWACLVRAKLAQQAWVLAETGKPTAPVTALISKVRSGDSGNIEAQGAQRYWPLLFGTSFRRDRTVEGINSLLNYGYTVLRAAMARAVVAAGLHPTLGLHHHNAGNAMCLVDDLMEPFRPLIDYCVWKLCQKSQEFITPETKQELVYVLYQDVASPQGRTPLMHAIQQLATSLAQVYVGERFELELPEPGVLDELLDDIN
ncbi:CRISPR-associated Cas1 family protein [Permianibacter aggregans]|uniref:CRISPR-associated Cas1 family protein n=1 Tax=Permianibacter aggregans TaxID=1510150 RepID=A0A4R6UG91_9GAMM|nr:CRISPR-associated Cas1 family protein [Permianibacter aggregans]